LERIFFEGGRDLEARYHAVGDAPLLPSHAALSVLFAGGTIFSVA